MNNADMPASPTSPNDSDPEWAAARSGGLTKREYFAGLAMQGLCSNSHLATPGSISVDVVDVITDSAIKHADRLLKKLNKGEG